MSDQTKTAPPVPSELGTNTGAPKTNVAKPSPLKRALAAAKQLLGKASLLSNATTAGAAAALVAQAVGGSINGTALAGILLAVGGIAAAARKVFPGLAK